MDSFLYLLQQGGWFMVPLLLASVVALAVILERLVFYFRLEAGGDGFRAKLRGYLLAGNTQEAMQWLRKLRGPVPATAMAALEAWGEGTAAVEAAMAARARREVPSMRRFLPVLDTAYSAAPLVGLLGTISGMMGTFRVVAQRISADPNANTSGVTIGIGEALITTATGISIAVVCLISYNFYVAWMESLMDATEAVAADILEALAESGASRSQATDAKPERAR